MQIVYAVTLPLYHYHITFSSHGIDRLILLWEVLDLSGHGLVSGLLKEASNHEEFSVSNLKFCFSTLLMIFFIIITSIWLSALYVQMLGT